MSAVVVLASTTESCVVCEGSGSVLIPTTGYPWAEPSFPVPCLHCVQRIPLLLVEGVSGATL